MSGTSSSTSSSTSSLGIRSYAKCTRRSISRESPERRFCSLEPVGQPDHALLVAVPDDQAAVAVLQDLLEQHDLADLVELQHVDDVHRLVDHHLLAG